MPAEKDAPLDQIAQLEATGQRHSVTFEGIQVTWRQFGHGPHLVLLHGGHGSWLHWARNIPVWAQQHTVWVPDLPGYGDSGAPPEPTLASLLGATRATLNALVGSDAPIALAGFSFGGLVAAHLAALRGHVTHLALFGPGGHGGARRPLGDLLPWREALAARDDAALAGVMRHNLAKHMLHAASAIDAQALHIHTQACLRTRFRSKPISRAGGLADRLGLHTGPLLLAWGEHDVTADPPAAATALALGRGDCQAHIVPAAGHWVQYEQAAAINRMLLAWLHGPDDGEQAKMLF